MARDYYTVVWFSETKTHLPRCKTVQKSQLFISLVASSFVIGHDLDLELDSICRKQQSSITQCECNTAWQELKGICHSNDNMMMMTTTTTMMMMVIIIIIIIIIIITIRYVVWMGLGGPAFLHPK